MFPLFLLHLFSFEIFLEIYEFFYYGSFIFSIFNTLFAKIFPFSWSDPSDYRFIIFNVFPPFLFSLTFPFRGSWFLVPKGPNFQNDSRLVLQTFVWVWVHVVTLLPLVSSLTTTSVCLWGKRKKDLCIRLMQKVRRNVDVPTPLF